MRTLFFALTAGLALTTPAHALDCIGWQVQGSLPADGALGVPTNARVAVQVYSWNDDQAAPVLYDAEENIIETSVDVHDAGTNMTFVLTPLQALEPGDYTVLVPQGWDDAAMEHVTSFTVSDSVDFDNPLRPTVTDYSADHDRDEWGDWYDVSVEMPEMDLDDNGVIYEWTVLDINGEQQFTRYTFSREQGLADNPCSDDVAATIPQRSLAIDIKAIDVAGNSSDEPIWECGTGCSVTGSAPIGGLFVLAPLAAMRRRRSRK